MTKFASFLGGLIVAAAFGVGAQVGGQIAEINAAAVYAGTLTASGTVDLNGAVKIRLPQYADDTAACAGGLAVGDTYYTTGSPNVLKIVASCS